MLKSVSAHKDHSRTDFVVRAAAKMHGGQVGIIVCRSAVQCAIQQFGILEIYQIHGGVAQLVRASES